MMIGFRPALECREHVDRGLPDVEFVDVPALGRLNQNDQTLVLELDLLARIQIVVADLEHDPGPGLGLGIVEGIVGGDQAAINRVAKMRQIKPAEGTMPVRTVALAAIELAPGDLQVVGVGALPGRGVGQPA